MSFHADFVILFSLGVLAWLIGFVVMTFGWVFGLGLRRLLSLVGLVSDVD